MKCEEFEDILYEHDELRLGERFFMAFHMLLCGRCALRARRYENARVFLAENFFPPCPDFSGAIMDRIEDEAYHEEEGAFEIPGSVSTRGWVTVGLLVLFSLTSAFFGRDFINVASLEGSSFLLPLGITVGTIVTAYGALFIGSHLKELSQHFKL
ncbi:MAG: peptidoglycan-binding protein [Treponema sp.]|nr:peptidoglycan-binding protein [Treponema sp.]